MNVNEATKGYFHCGRCGGFFQAEIGAVLVRRCPNCGADPALDLEDRTESKLPAADADVVRGMTVGDAPVSLQAAAETTSRSSHRRRGNPALRRLVIFIAGWIILLAVFAVFMKVGNDRREREEAKRLEAYKRSRVENPVGLEISSRVRDREFLRDNFPACHETFVGFLDSASVEARMQWVYGSVDTAGPMTRFYQSNLPYRPKGLPENEYAGVIEAQEGPVIESLWVDEDGRRIEVHFRNDDGEWRLDWEGFVRFSETPWVMFVAGGGEDVQEFRLLARERLAEERQLEPEISLVLHPPRFGLPEEVGPASREFEVSRLSDAGRKLEALFRLKEEDKAPLGARLPGEDPDEMIRVRLRVRRIDDDVARRKFVIEEVLAGHWMGIPESGIPDGEEDGEESGSAE